MHGPLNVKTGLSEIRTVSLQHNRRIVRLSNLIFWKEAGLSYMKPMPFMCLVLPLSILCDSRPCFAWSAVLH